MGSDTCVLGDWDLYEGAYDVKAAAVLEGGIRCDLNVNVVREVLGGPVSETCLREPLHLTSCYRAVIIALAGKGPATKASL